jgi:hypothetical protein
MDLRKIKKKKKEEEDDSIRIYEKKLIIIVSIELRKKILNSHGIYFYIQ